MKVLLSILCCLVVALDLRGQGSKKFTSLSDLDDHFEEVTEAAMLKVNKDRLAAIEAFLGDKANKDNPDVGKAKAAAAELKVMIATKVETNASALKDAHGKYLGTLGTDDVRQALDVTSQVVDRMIELDDIAGAKAVWAVLPEKFADHPQVTQIEALVKTRSADVEIIGTEPKAFKVKDLKDAELSIEKYKGKVLLIDFWATWCGPCVHELPNVIAAYKKFHSKGFEVIGISLDKEDKTVLEKFLTAHPDMTWAQFYDGKFWKNEVAVAYGIQSIPATYLLDQSGKVYRVGLRGKALDKAIERLLSKGGSK